jgi:hypothetical protein
MTTITAAEPLTARGFLLGHAIDDSTEALARAMCDRDVARAALRGVRRLSAPALAAVDCRIAAVTARLLDVRLGDALASAWRSYAALAGAAERTFAVPASEEVVVLARHRVTWTCEPQLDLLVDGTKVATLDFRLALAFVLDGVVAVVRLGDLVALRGGECTITASLALHGQTLVQRQERTQPAVVLPLDPPVSLLGGGASFGGPERGPAPTDRAASAMETA